MARQFRRALPPAVGHNVSGFCPSGKAVAKTAFLLKLRGTQLSSGQSDEVLRKFALHDMNSRNHSAQAGVTFYQMS